MFDVSNSQIFFFLWLSMAAVTAFFNCRGRVKWAQSELDDDSLSEVVQNSSHGCGMKGLSLMPSMKALVAGYMSNGQRLEKAFHVLVNARSAGIDADSQGIPDVNGRTLTIDSEVSRMYTAPYGGFRSHVLGKYAEGRKGIENPSSFVSEPESQDPQMYAPGWGQTGTAVGIDVASLQCSGEYDLYRSEQVLGATRLWSLQLGGYAATVGKQRDSAEMTRSSTKSCTKELHREFQHVIQIFSAAKLLLSGDGLQGHEAAKVVEGSINAGLKSMNNTVPASLSQIKDRGDGQHCKGWKEAVILLCKDLEASRWYTPIP
ncbi:hypothetical protein IW262DRAFT_1298098 [Armillaria fumosa]|nr:hypothetical protein IW262DRAFT_1298098 [Armillaria fumosa]